jgi:hypothetical protein
MYSKKPTPKNTGTICATCGNRLKEFELFFNNMMCGKCINKTKPNGERNIKNNTTGRPTNTGEN